MRPNAKQLVLRDPALAALMGAIQPGSDFGSDFGEDFGDPDDDYAGEFGDPDDDEDFGAEFGLARRPPSSQRLAAMWKQGQLRRLRSNKRVMHLDPNRGSGVKVERYTLALNQQVAIGTAVALTLQQQPDTTFRPQDIVSNVPAPGFATATQIRMANVGVLAGGLLDLWNINANALKGKMDLPTLSPANRATITGNYTGFAAGYPAALAFDISVSMTGPASLAGGSGI